MNHLKKLYQLSNNLSVLYVEDDLLLQENTHQMLNNIFKNIDTATNGQEAVEIYQDYFYTNAKYYDIIITDIKMPIMNGLEFSKKILNLNNKQIIVVTSAHDESKYLIEFINIQIKRFIKKPFTLDSIISSFLCILDSSLTLKNQIIINEEYYWENINKELFLNKQAIKLSHNEKIILDVLLNNQSNILSNVDLYYIIQSSSIANEVTENTIKSAIKRLRKKLPDNSIVNIYGQGYKITLLNPKFIS
jgi:DNA-binding response OmpR family regulator